MVYFFTAIRFFQVFTSTSTTAFKIFPCDDEVVEGESYLRADYSLSCNAEMHMYFRVYAGMMIVVRRRTRSHVVHRLFCRRAPRVSLVDDFSVSADLSRLTPPSYRSAVTSQIYPIGIPLLYAFILWVHRESLNPRVESIVGPEPDGETAKGSTPSVAPQQDDLQERIAKRGQNPDLVPSMFLWKDFGEMRPCLELLVARRHGRAGLDRFCLGCMRNSRCLTTYTLVAAVLMVLSHSVGRRSCRE